MAEQQITGSLQEAIQPFLAKGYQVVAQNETAVTMVRRKQKLPLWKAVTDTVAYAKNTDKTVSFQAVSGGGVNVTGYTLADLASDQRYARTALGCRIALIVLVVGIPLACLLLTYLPLLQGRGATP